MRPIEEVPAKNVRHLMSHAVMQQYYLGKKLKHKYFCCMYVCRSLHVSRKSSKIMCERATGQEPRYVYTRKRGKPDPQLPESRRLAIKYSSTTPASFWLFHVIHTCRRCWWTRTRSTPRSPAGSLRAAPPSPASYGSCPCLSARKRIPTYAEVCTYETSHSRQT